MDLAQYQRLTEAVEEAQRTADKASGALEQLKSRLQAEFDCPSIKRGRELLQKLLSDQAAEEVEYERLLTDFRKRYPELFDAGNGRGRS